MLIRKTLKHHKPAALAQLVGGALILMSASGLAHAAGVPNTFTSGTTISSSQMNANFTAVEADIANPGVTGNITMVPAAATAGTPTAGVIFKNVAGLPVPFIHDYGTNNAFLGVHAGNFNMTGSSNIGIGAYALYNNTSGTSNTASGQGALQFNTTGTNNTASGQVALNSNTAGNSNTASGQGALQLNTSGNSNTASGLSALYNNTIGSNNTAIGVGALSANTTGSNNIALGMVVGVGAGSSLTAGNYNIDIGNVGVAGESGTIRIGTAGNQTRTFVAGITGVTTGGAAVGVFVDANGQLGTLSSSQRFKDDINNMGDASDVLMKLRPVTFHYKVDRSRKERPLQYGLIAEEVAKVAPQLVAYTDKGEIETVYYQHLAPMLLNEYQKQQRTIKAQEAQLKVQSAQLARETQRVAALEKQGQELVALKLQLNRMSAVLARLEGSEKVAFTDR